MGAVGNQGFGAAASPAHAIIAGQVASKDHTAARNLRRVTMTGRSIDIPQRHENKICRAPTACGVVENKAERVKILVVLLARSAVVFTRFAHRDRLCLSSRGARINSSERGASRREIAKIVPSVRLDWLTSFTFAMDEQARNPVSEISHTSRCIFRNDARAG
jgi:hypothetical protein